MQTDRPGPTVPSTPLSVPHTPASRLDRILWFCAGANRALLEHCPSADRVKFQGMGGFVLATGLLAGGSGAYAFYTVFSPKVATALDRTLHVPTMLVSLLFGLLWGLIIFNIDRFIVSSTGKGDGSDAITWSEFARSIPRLVMATVIAFAISSPLEIRILQPEINAQLELEQNEYVQRLNETSGRDIAAKQEEVRKSIATNLESVAKLQKTWDARRVEIDQQQHELDLEAEGRSGSGRAGVGPAFRVKVDTRDRLQAAWDRDRPVNEAEQARLKETNAQLETRLQELATGLDSLRDSNLKVARSQDGLLKRIQISHEIGGAVPWLIFAMLFIIETGPIFFKMMIVKGTYDYFEENLKHLELARAGIELEAKVYVTEENREVRVDVFHQAVRALEEEKDRLRTERALSRIVHDSFEATTAADIRRDPSKFVLSPEHKAVELQS